MHGCLAVCMCTSVCAITCVSLAAWPPGRLVCFPKCTDTRAHAHMRSRNKTVSGRYDYAVLHASMQRTHAMQGMHTRTHARNARQHYATHAHTQRNVRMQHNTPHVHTQHNAGKATQRTHTYATQRTHATQHTTRTHATQRRQGNATHAHIRMQTTQRSTTATQRQRNGNTTATQRKCLRERCTAVAGCVWNDDRMSIQMSVGSDVDVNDLC